MATFIAISVRYMSNMRFLIVLLLLLLLEASEGQQTYVNNKQLDCNQNYTNTLGFICNGEAMSCGAYLTFRTTTTYNSPATIGYLLSVDPSQIAKINNISDVTVVPDNTLLIVPVNCSCTGGRFYQHNASYVLKTPSETYFSVANNTYQALSTCQSMMSQNPYNMRALSPGLRLNVPLMCACPTANQTAAGIKYLLTYLVKEGDSYDSIANLFRVDDINSILNANELTAHRIIFFFTPLLVPLKAEPIGLNTSASGLTPPPPPPPPPSTPPTSSDSSSRKWVFIGVGIGIGVLILVSLSVCLVLYSRRRSPPRPEPFTKNQNSSESAVSMPKESSNSWSVISESLHLKDAVASLTVYKFEELQKATDFFAEANRMKGNVYRGCFKGDYAAVKEMKGDVSGEIKVFNSINHSNIIMLSGFCIHQGHTYLVYEYAENGPLSDRIHHQQNEYEDIDNKKSSVFQHSFTPTTLGWKQRVQIAYDIADAINYLHNYAYPPYIHKNLKSSNIFLDANMRAKLANFGLARAADSSQSDKETGSLIMTKHVVGTHGYMAPEYVENGLVTPKLDVFAMGVVMLELLSGKEAAAPPNRNGKEGGGEELLSATIARILDGENVREKLRGFIDPCLGQDYPLDSAYAMAELAKNCVSSNLDRRPGISEAFVTLSKILSSSLDWDPSDEREHSRSLGHGR